MKKFITFFLILLLSYSISANNVQLENISLVNQSSGSHTFVKFDISWDNSWRGGTDNGNNWDAAWVFIKYKTLGGNWEHATLNSTGHTVPTGTTIETSSDGKGIFIYRNSNGTGSVDWNNVELRWNYDSDGLGDGDDVTVKVFGIEMVYVPSGAYQLGDGSAGATTNHFYPYGSNNASFTVNSNTIDIGTTAGNLTADGDIPLPTTLVDFPTGFNPYYIMKYEITNGQYRDFLNTLTFTQQAARTDSDVPPSDPIGSKALADQATAYRNSIEIVTSGVASTTPAVYGCDLNENNIFNEASDGEFVACNFLNWNDLLSYADWAGLRPMTELEYEKSCRGVSITSVAGEYAWGTTSIYAAQNGHYTLTNPGADSEVTNENLDPVSSSFGNCNYVTTNPTVISGNQGVFRSGVFATSISDRTIAGAGYYGVMEMSGNVWEMAVPITQTGFTGLHGDGTITAAGVSDVTNWPITGGVRGGDFIDPVGYCRLSDRTFATFNDAGTRYNSFGGRLVRTAL